ncbi:MAG TPA: family 16 glycosylhydrolase [Saprospiraceae bacterium]|nr:family 16 glycosylhydrolase [Saprospiraceae bacterium]
MTLVHKIFSFIFILSFAIAGKAQCPKLVWADEFDGTSLNTNNWSYEIGDGCDIGLCGWGNSELQWYTNSNATVSNGILTIAAKRETGGNGKQYTSSRIRTNNKVDIKYGRIEARLKMPVGQGIWPAFWMLPTDRVYGDWPRSGELDIMEYLGHEPFTTHGTLHFGDPWPNNSSVTGNFVTQGKGLNEGFHDYVVEWKENSIKWFVDGYLYSEKKPSDLSGKNWPFNQRFHFLLNMAVGGNWPGNPNGLTVFPQNYQIDYIRVYDLVDQPYIVGAQKVNQGEAGKEYKIENLPTNATTAWTVPEGATITTSSDKSIRVTFGTASGAVKALVTTPCGTTTLEIAVKAEGALAPSITLEDFDTPGKITRKSSTGVFSDNAPNPGKSSINDSDLCGKYARSSGDQYDVLVYTMSDITDASQFTSGEKKLYVDIHTNAPIGSTILFQLENSNTALANNYPTGRHSRYQATTKKQNEWERIVIPYLDRPDQSVPNGSVNQLIILFAPNSFTNHTYYFDNFQIYARGVSTGVIEDKLNQAINIHPVPTQDELNFTVDGYKMNILEIFDSIGNLVLKKGNIQSERVTLQVGDLPAGQYSARITTTNQITTTRKFLKI